MREKLPKLLHHHARTSFLSRFPEDMRSAVVVFFAMRVRKGHRTPEGLYLVALQEASRRARLSTLERDRIKYGLLSSVMLEHPELALGFCRWVLEWEALPWQEKERIKEARAERYRREWMRQQPPTEKQLAYLRKLGWTGAVLSRQHASELIEKLARRRG